MDSGIYALYWWDQDLVYVGLSQNLVRRKHQHYADLASGTHINKKVQQAYSCYGIPDFIVLEYSTIGKLSKLEQAWGEELEVMGPRGLNIQEPGWGPGYGTSHNTSIYSKFQILKTFSLLYKGNLSVPEISKRTRVSITNIHNISNEDTHTWLREAYPEKYELMRKVDRVSLGRVRKNKKAILKGPDGKEYTVYSLNEFCRQYFGSVSPAGNLSELINGKCNMRYGFTLITRF